MTLLFLFFFIIIIILQKLTAIDFKHSHVGFHEIKVLGQTGNDLL